MNRSLKFFKGTTENPFELESTVNAYITENVGNDVTVTVIGGEYHITVAVLVVSPASAPVDGVGSITMNQEK